MPPDAVSLVSIHGTGTPLGDPIEIGALGHALTFHSSTTVPHQLTVSSVKLCYGHTDGAAGLTGALLAVQAMRHQVGQVC